MTTITLKKPVEHDGKVHPSIEIDEPTLGGLGAYEEARAAGKGHYNAVAALVAFEFSWPVPTAQRICFTDADAIWKVLNPFFSEETSGSGGEPQSPKSPPSSDGAIPT